MARWNLPGLACSSRAMGGLWARLDLVKAGLVLLPFLCLVGYWTDAGLPFPAFLLPERCYLVLGREHDEVRMRLAERGGGTFAALPGRLVPAGLADELTDAAPIEPVLRDLEAGIGPFRRARVVFGEPPLPAELEALAAAAGPVPLAVEVAEGRPQAPVQALGVTYAPSEKRVAFELLLGPDCRSCAAVEVRAGATLLYAARGADLPADRVLRLSVDRAEAGALAASFREASGKLRTMKLALGADAEAEPKVLVITDRPAGRSFIEALYPARRATPAEAAGLDLLAYELVVVDGTPLKEIQGTLRQGLLEVAARRTGSLLFAADSPRFGRKGDNPPLEELLPVTLLPRSLKDLPDLAVLILLDVSGSMFGDKLSLAKVTGLELLRSLKPGDRVGMLLFSDERRWLYDFQPDAGIQASPALGPLSAGGGTDLHPALAEGLARLAGQPIKAKHVVLITDGITRPADFQPLVEEARRKGISISAMGVGLDANRPLLERLALQTEGRYYPVESVEAVPSLLFQDRMSEARAIFGQGRIPVLAMSGEQVGWVGGMAQYTPIPTASVLFADKAGDPLLASREQGNRAVLLFASDLHGGYTGEFFASREAVGAFKDRLDALFARRPVQVRVVQTARGISVLVRSDDLVAPALLLSRAGAPPVTCPFRRMDPGGWVAEAVLPFQGIWNAAILERGGSLAAFRIGVSGGLGGVRSDSAAALAAFRPKRFRIVRLPSLWLGLFFAASLACTVCLRVKR